MGDENRKISLICSFCALLVAGVVYWPWFLHLGILTNGDWSFYNLISQKELLQLPAIWDNRELGSVNIGAPFYPTNLLWGALAYVTSFAISERIIFLWPSVLLAALGSYLFLKRYLKFPLAALAGSYIFTYCGYFLILRSGDVTLAVTYALAPLLLLLLFQAIETKNFRLTILCSLACFVGSFYEFRVFYIISWIMLGYAAFMLFVVKRSWSYARDLAIYVAPVFVLIGLLNAYWLIGFAKLGQLSSNAAFANSLFGGQYLNISEALTLAHPFWSSTGQTAFIQQQIPMYLWLLPIAAICGLILGRRKPIVVYFAIVGCVGILLTKQQALPFTNLYLWLFKNLPGFNAFREASKFFGLIAISYAVLIGTFIDWALERWSGSSAQKIAVIGLIAVMGVVSLANTLPLIQGKSGALSVSRSLPADYAILNRYLASQGGFFRTAWLLTASRWGAYTSAYPKLSVLNEINGDWANLLSSNKNLKGDSSELKAISFLQLPYANEVISVTGAKYLIIPLRDTSNDDDFFHDQDRQFYIDTLASLPWLHRVNLGTKEVAVFENPSYKPYFSVLTKVVNLASLQNLEQKYSFITGALGSEFAFAPPGTAQPGAGLADPFESPGRVNVNGGTISARVPSGAGETAYINTVQSQISYQVANGTLNFIQHRLVGLMVDGQPLGPQINETKPIDKTPLRANGEFVLGQGSALTDIDMGDSSVRDLGTPTQPPVVYSVEAGNRVSNPELADGLWRHTVEDCNNYDSSPIISMNLVTDDQQASKVLELTADRHIACTGPDPVAVRAGESLMVNFDYRAVQSSQAGYQLVWSGPGVVSGASVERNYLPVTDNSWRTLQRLVTVPAGATNLRVLLEAIPNDQRPVEGIARYTNLRVSGLTVIDTPPVATAPKYATEPLPAGAKTVSVTDPALSGRNLIANPSLESGLWQPAVGDCNAYDDNPAVGQQLDTRDHSAGRQSLELTAKRHIACTGPPAVSVQEGHTYLLSVDYQSPNAKTASVSVSFNDPNHSRSGNTSIAVPDANWHTFNQTFTAPFGATKANITVSASAVDPAVTTIINRYDNVRLTEIAPAAGQYYLVGAGPANLRAPAHISFTLSSPTKKIVHITGAAGPFYLAMSEAYHPGWRLELANSRSQGGLAGWWPWAHPQAIGNNNHFSLDDFLNGWYIDPAALCHSHASGCTINKDGSYNLELIAEFAPQRWFYLGLIISITTLLACLGYLVRIWRTRRRHKNADIKKRHSAKR